MSSTLLKLRRYSFHAQDHGVHVSRAYFPYFPCEWIAEMPFMLFFAYIAVQRTEHS